MAINYDRLVGTAIKFADKSLSKNDRLQGRQQNRVGKSIKTLTKDLILQFPLLLSEQISYDNAKILAEGFERENALLVKLLLQNDLGSLSDFDGNAKAHVSSMLQQIHTNIDSHPLNEQSMLNESLKQLIPIEDKFNKYSLNEGTLPRYFHEASAFTTTSDTHTEYSVHRNVATGRDEQVTAQVGTTTDSAVSHSFVDKSHSSYNPDLFEKINKLAPTMIEMTIHVEQGTTNASITGTTTQRSIKDVDIAYGVKCVVHQLRSDDIIHNIKMTVTDNSLFKAIKWTTGEYSFAKGIGELVFDFDRMKELGIQTAKTSNYWWFKLKKLKMNNRAKFLTKGSKVAPTKTATLLLSKEEVDYIGTTYRIDLKQPKQAYKLMNELFLLNFGYVDESTNMVHLFDEISKAYIVKNFDDFKSKTRNKALDIDDIKSLFGR